MSISNSTFSGNSASSPNGDAVYLANSIFANSPSGGDCFDTIHGAILPFDLGGNLADDGSCAFTQGSTNYLTGLAQTGSTNNATGLNLGALADNGGPTQTMALLLGSPALGAADSSAPAWSRCSACWALRSSCI